MAVTALEIQQRSVVLDGHAFRKTDAYAIDIRASVQWDLFHKGL